MIRIQEIIYKLKPDVIIETGIAHGGSLIFYASLCKAMEKGRVIGIDIEIREHNRDAIESHELYPYINLIEGSSVDKNIINKVRELINKNEIVLVILDSNHSKEHVYNELKEYCDMVSIGSYIIATDGIMKDLYDVPRGESFWVNDNPANAAKDFVKVNNNFIIDQPKWIFNESNLSENITHWPGAWLKRIR
jgi:cephalosporin hydroxylase